MIEVSRRFIFTFCSAQWAHGRITSPFIHNCRCFTHLAETCTLIGYTELSLLFLKCYNNYSLICMFEMYTYMDKLFWAPVTVITVTTHANHKSNGLITGRWGCCTVTDTWVQSLHSDRLWQAKELGFIPAHYTVWTSSPMSADNGTSYNMDTCITTVRLLPVILEIS